MSSKSSSSPLIPAIIWLAVLLTFTTYQCSVQSECEAEVKCPAGQTPDAVAPVLGFGFDYTCVCGVDK